jgi:hypothetical protein
MTTFELSTMANILRFELTVICFKGTLGISQCTKRLVTIPELSGAVGPSTGLAGKDFILLAASTIHNPDENMSEIRSERGYQLSQKIAGREKFVTKYQVPIFDRRHWTFRLNPAYVHIRLVIFQTPPLTVWCRFFKNFSTNKLILQYTDFLYNFIIIIIICLMQSKSPIVFLQNTFLHSLFTRYN